MKPDLTETGPDDARAAAQYIEAMARGLKGMAARADLTVLVYFLEMAEIEASSAARRIGRRSEAKPRS